MEKKTETAEGMRARLKAIADESAAIKAALADADREENAKLSGVLDRIKEILARAGISAGTIVLNLDTSTIARSSKGQGAPRGPRASKEGLEATTDEEIILSGAVVTGPTVKLASGKTCSTSRFASVLLRDKRASNKDLLALGLSQGQINGAHNAVRGTGGRKIPAM